MTCDYCGKIVRKLKSYSSKNKHFYCCIDCKAKAQEKQIKTECVVCHKIFYLKQSVYDRHDHHCCSYECDLKRRSVENHEDRICPICHKRFTVLKSSSKEFCSPECQIIWQKNSAKHGIENEQFSRELIKCDWCGKDFYVKKYKCNNGQKHFCSTECRQKWYSNVWSQSIAWKNESRQRALYMLSHNMFPRTNTKPQRIVNEILKNMNIKFTNEKVFDNYVADNYLDSYNLIIEIMGDFWHTNPITNSISYSRQEKRIINDYRKRLSIKNKYQIDILYLWENDIYQDPKMCLELIKLYISSHGNLQNYNSFNYQLINNKLELKSNILLAFFENKKKIKQLERQYYKNP